MTVCIADQSVCTRDGGRWGNYPMLVVYSRSAEELATLLWYVGFSAPVREQGGVAFAVLKRPSVLKHIEPLAEFRPIEECPVADAMSRWSPTEAAERRIRKAPKEKKRRDAVVSGRRSALKREREFLRRLRQYRAGMSVRELIARVERTVYNLEEDLTCLYT